MLRWREGIPSDARSVPPFYGSPDATERHDPRMTSSSSMPPRKRFIVLTGCNGVGKSTVAEALRVRLDATVFHYPPEFVAFRAAVALDTRVAPVPRLLYYLAATLQLADLVREQLAGHDVICDRYLESPVSLLLAEDAIAEEELDRFRAPFESRLLVPDVTLLLTADYATACRRIRARQPARSTRVEQLVLSSPDFFHRREAALRREARRRGPLVELDTTSLSLTVMSATAEQLVREHASGR